MSFLYKNNAISRLKYDAGVGDGTLTLLDGEGAKFPNPGAGDFFIVTIDDRRSGQVEICHCTSRSGDVLTVTRAQEGTAAQAFLKDATVANRFTAGTLDIILSTSGYSKPEADAKFVDVTGDTMTGPLILPVGTPPSNQAATTKLYVDAQIATRAPEAPNDGTAYGRKNLGWVAVVDTLTYTAADILTKLKTVDGSSSGLDADLLDGHDTTYFATQAGLDGANANISSNTSAIAANQSAITALQSGKADINSPVFTGTPSAPTPAPGDNDTSIATTAFVQTGLNTKLDGSAYTAADVLAKLLTVDGSGSGLDADTLDGHDTAYFATAAADALKAPIASPTFTGDPKAPTPATADNDTSIATTAYVKAQGYLTDAPADGLVYGRKNNTWSTVIGGAATDDAPPAGPLQDGQLWWKSNTGALFIWFDDGNSQQWVQIAGPTVAGAYEPPSDGGEYVRVNGAWRLIRQCYAPSGVSTIMIPVPATAKLARIRGHLFGQTTGLNPVVRYSLDGSSVFSGASDYVSGGSYLYTGSSGSPQKVALATASFLNLGSYTDMGTSAVFIDCDFVTQKPASQYFNYRSRMSSYHSAATALLQESFLFGYPNAAALISATQLAGIQLTLSGGTNFFAGSAFTVEWGY